jgi:hypothetical protein
MEAMKRLNHIHRHRDGYGFTPANVSFREGNLADEYKESWLTGVDFAFCNNFDGVWNGARDGKQNLDDYNATLFASMKVGAKFVTMTSLEASLHHPSRTEANKRRDDNGLGKNDCASFYEVVEFAIGKQKLVTSWSQGSSCCTKMVTAFMYTRVEQGSNSGGHAVYMCCNPECEDAKNKVISRAVKGALITWCEKCNKTNKPTRERKEIDRFIPGK